MNGGENSCKRRDSTMSDERKYLSYKNMGPSDGGGGYAGTKVPFLDP
jgi:hypothetical protein